MLYTVFLCTIVTVQLNTSDFLFIFFFGGLLPVLKEDPGVIPGPEVSRTEEPVQLP